MTIAEFIEYAEGLGCELRETEPIKGPRGDAYNSVLVKKDEEGRVVRTAQVPDLPYHSEQLHDCICGMCNQLAIEPPPGVTRWRYHS